MCWVRARAAAEAANRNRPTSPPRLTATSTKGPRGVSPVWIISGSIGSRLLMSAPIELTMDRRATLRRLRRDSTTGATPTNSPGNDLDPGPHRNLHRPRPIPTVPAPPPATNMLDQRPQGPRRAPPLRIVQVVPGERCAELFQNRHELSVGKRPAHVSLIRHRDPQAGDGEASIERCIRRE